MSHYSSDILLEIFKFLKYEDAYKSREVAKKWNFLVIGRQKQLAMKVVHDKIALNPDGITFIHDEFAKCHVGSNYKVFKNVCFEYLNIYVYERNRKMMIKTLKRLARLNQKVHVKNLEFNTYTYKIFRDYPRLFSTIFNLSSLKIIVNECKSFNYLIKNPAIVRLPNVDVTFVDAPRGIFTYWGVNSNTDELIAFLFDEESFGNREEFFICVKNADIIEKVFKEFVKIPDPSKIFKKFFITLHKSIVTQDLLNTMMTKMENLGAIAKGQEILDEEVYGDHEWNLHEKSRKDGWVLKAYLSANYNMYYHWLFKVVKV